MNFHPTNYYSSFYKLFTSLTNIKLLQSNNGGKKQFEGGHITLFTVIGAKTNKYCSSFSIVLVADKMQ
ncbi:hypothetical protein SAMN05192550_0242 [Flavobacterium glycines]|uniref:Uncharacterized protein n=1 Tax=Flavobacterium glycines TaxID=551990 RepID=A0A1B9DPP4_9FLAO|nr:hypothetical protein FBGL_10615 [Flavobacterium glycines]GEL10712.1 hypothetical protein FGL01_14510 [Flavobacterium glycines]SDI57416.1 hypothetical protein SAMN05192550_0242 [Flavobacterium glycines]